MKSSQASCLQRISVVFWPRYSILNFRLALEMTRHNHSRIRFQPAWRNGNVVEICSTILSLLKVETERTPLWGHMIRTAKHHHSGNPGHAVQANRRPSFESKKMTIMSLKQKFFLPADSKHINMTDNGAEQSFFHQRSRCS